jgi:pimeloyl-ACP methyl ester carboxylesterase
VLVSPTFLEERPHFLEHMTARALAYPTPLYSAIRQAMAIQRFNTYGRLGQIIAPTLILTGIGDLVVPPANSHLLAARIPGALLHVIPEAGHGFFWENPQHFVDLVQSFCIQEGWQWRDDTRRKHF